ncbi:antirestriction protein ArdA [Enterococcus entomosocium]|uniref:antirestriction protein ArdA n=1 Tax=Enterococcus entomosocium TaxID=3034352 RepID=UPI002648193A|nr:antirestriction protein ArdA [Enterococcus entomosocium]
MIELYIENLHTHKGRWFELPVQWEEVKDKIGLEDGHEYLITDYMAPLTISHYENFNEMNEIAEELDENGNNPAVKYLGELVEYGFFTSILEAFEQIDEIQVYCDCYSYKDYAEQLVDDLGYLSGVPDIIKWNIDYEGIGEDLRQDGRLYQANDNTIIEVMT